MESRWSRGRSPVGGSLEDRHERSTSRKDRHKGKRRRSSSYSSSPSRGRSPVHRHSKRRYSCSSSSSSPSSSRSPSRSRHRRRKRDDDSVKKRKRSHRSSSSSSCSDSESSPERRHKKSKKEHKPKKKEKHKDSKHKKDKKKKKEKEKRKSKTAVNQSKFGKYGLLTDPDIYTKQAEFYLWLYEVKKMDAETVARGELKRLFDDFKEDYNTATLPHKKYYNLEVYESRRRIKKMRKGEAKPKKCVSMANDEEAHRKLHVQAARFQMNREELLRMQQAMREQKETEYKKVLGL